MKFKKEILQDLDRNKEFEIISEEVIDTSRWSIHYERIFKHDGKIYATSFSRGATEQQMECPYEYDDDEIECPEQEEYTVTITRYRDK